MLGDSKFCHFGMTGGKLTWPKLTISCNTGSLVLLPQLGDRFWRFSLIYPHAYNRYNSKRNEIIYLVNGLGLTQVLISVVGHSFCNAVGHVVGRVFPRYLSPLLFL